MTTVCITCKLETEIESFMTSMESLQRESSDIYAVYWKTDANTTLGGFSDSDPVTITTKLTKAELVAGVTFCEELEDFFTGEAVSQSDYLQTLLNIRYGNNEKTSPVASVAVEAIGDRLYQVSLDCIQLFKNAKDILDVYTNNEIGDMVTNFDNHRIIWGSNMNKLELNEAITLVEQYKKMINNEVVSTASYGDTVAKWGRLGS